MNENLPLTLLYSQNVCILFQPHTLLNHIKQSTTETEQETLLKISSTENLGATLLPIKTVGVQVSER